MLDLVAVGHRGKLSTQPEGSFLMPEPLSGSAGRG